MTGGQVDRKCERHPGGRPRRRAADDGRRGRRPGHLRRAQRGLRTGPLDDVAPARRPGAHPAARAHRPGGVRRRPAVRAVRRPPRPHQAAGPAGPPDAGGARRAAPGRPCTSPSTTAAGSSTSARSTPPTCSAPATGTTSRCRRTAPRWARCCSPGRCSSSPRVGSSPRRTRPSRSRSDLEDDLAWVRARGYAVTHDELEVGLSGVAAPVFGPDDDVVAAVGVSGPTARLEERAAEVGQLLIDHTQALSRRLQPGTRTEDET